MVGPVLELVCGKPVLDESNGEIAGVEAVLDFAGRNALEDGNVGGVEVLARLRGFEFDFVEALQEGVGGEPLTAEVDLGVNGAES